MADNNTVHDEIILDADGKPVLAIIDAVGQKLGGLKTQMEGLFASANNGTVAVTAKFEQQLRGISQQIQSLESAVKIVETKGRGPVTAAVAEQSFGKQALAAAAFKAKVDETTGAAGLLQIRLNAVTEAAAKLGNSGKTSTMLVGERQNTEKAISELKRYQAELDKIDAKIRRTPGAAVTFAEPRAAVVTAQSALTKAVADPNRTAASLAPELQALSDAQFKLGEQIRTRRAEILASIREQAQLEKTEALNRTQEEKAYAALQKQHAAEAKAAAKITADEAKAAAAERKLYAVAELEQLKARAVLSAQEAAKEGRLDAARRESLAELQRLRSVQANPNTTPQEILGVKELIAVEQARTAELRVQLNLKRQLSAEAEKAAAKSKLEGNQDDRVGLEVERAKNRERIRAITDVETLKRLQSEAAARQRAALEGTIGLSREELQLRLQIVATEEKSIQAIKAQVAEQKRLAATARADNPTPASRPNILPAGGIGTVIARTAAYAAAGTGIFAVVGALEKATSFTLEFEDALAKLQAISGSTNGQMLELTKTIEQVGSSSRFSLKELTEAATVLAQGGLSADAIAKSLSSISTLAAASGSTLKQSTDVVTSAIGAFGLQEGDTANIADSLTAALNRSKLTIEQVAQSIQTAGATSAEAGISFQQLVAYMGGLANAGVKGQIASTGLRTFLADLLSPSQKLSDELRSLGVTFEDIDVKTRGLPAVLDTLKTSGFGAAEAYGSLDRRSAAFYLAIGRQLPTIQAIADAENELGAAARAAAKGTDSFSAQWTIFTNNLSGGSASLFGGILDFFKDFLKESNRVIENNTQLNEKILEARDLRNAGKITNEEYAATVERINVQFREQNKLYNDNSKQFKTYYQELDKVQTASAKANDAVQAQNQKLNSLDEAISNAILHQKELKDNSSQLGTETNSLTNRFSGLAANLDLTKNSFAGLMGALRAYRVEELNLLSRDLGDLGIKKQAELNKLTTGTNAQLNSVQRTFAPQLAKDPRLAALLEEFRTSDKLKPDQQAVPARKLLEYSEEKYGPKAGDNKALVDAINQLVLSNQDRRGARAALVQADQEKARVDYTKRPVAQGLQAEAENLPRGDGKSIDAFIAKVNRGLATNAKEKPGSATQLGIAKALEDIIYAANSRRGSAGALADPKPVKKTEAERDAEKGPPVTRADVISAVKSALPSVTVGSGYRSQAEQDAIKSSTKAKVSDHTTGIGQDFPTGNVTQKTGEAMAAAAQKALRDKGIKAYVQFENGENGNGTGKHIHVGVKKNARKSPDDLSAPIDEDLSVDEQERDAAALALKNDLKDLGKASSKELFEARAAKAKKDFDAWTETLRRVAEDESATLPSAKRDAFIQASEEKIAEETKKFNETISAALIKSITAQLKITEDTFKRAIAPAEAALKKAQGRLSGLDYASVGVVPDYVRTLASQRVAKASEARDHAIADALPAKQAEYEARAADLQNAIDVTPKDAAHAGSLDQLKTQLEQLKDKIDDAKASKEAFDEAFAAKADVPTTFSEAISKSVEAIRGAKDFGLSFKQILVNDVGNALEETHKGLETFFSDILTGSKSAGQAIGDFARSMLNYLAQLAAKAAASKVFELILGTKNTGGGEDSGSSSGGGGIAGFFSNLLGGTKQGSSQRSNSSNGSNSLVEGDQQPNEIEKIHGFPKKLNTVFDEVTAKVKDNGGGFATGLGLVFSQLLGSLGSGKTGKNRTFGDNLLEGFGAIIGAVAGGLGKNSSSGEGHFTGGPIGFDTGGEVMNGSPLKDSVHALLAKGEFVMQKSAVDSVGPDFMAKLNKNGSKALAGLSAAPMIPRPAPPVNQQMSVYVVRPEDKPSLGPNDVLLIVQDDILKDGSTRKLIKHVSQGG